MARVAGLDAETTAALSGLRSALVAARAPLHRELPWIGVSDPWATYVAEVMLQQTSTSRVAEPWRRFVERFPTPRSCAEAGLDEVLRAWRGLGFPRRAKALHDAAALMVERHAGRVPSRVEQLLALPGVGHYTAHAVASFAFGERVAVLDTNVGRVLARALANRPLAQREARELAAALLPRREVAAFNQAMLDLGAQFCTATPRCEGCPVARRCRWRREGGADPAPRSAAVSRPQGLFAGSDRQIRGRVLQCLEEGARTRQALGRELADVDAARLDGLVERLAHEGLIGRRGGRLVLGGTAASPR